MAVYWPATNRTNASVAAQADERGKPQRSQSTQSEKQTASLCSVAESLQWRNKMTPTNDSPDAVQTIAVACNHCGAPLSVPDDARFVTCTHCGSQLEIHRSGGAAFTKVLEQLDQRTARVEQDLAEIKIREQIDELDRRWESKRDQYMIHGKDGGSSEPSSGNAVGTAAMLGLSGLLALCAGGAKGSNVVLVVGAGLLIVALFFGVTVANWAREYELAKSLYQQNRDDLMQKLEQLRK